MSHKVWKFKDFSATLNFPWNQFWQVWNLKNYYFDNFRGSEFWFWGFFLQFFEAQILKIQSPGSQKTVKLAIFDIQILLKLISRKIEWQNNSWISIQPNCSKFWTIVSGNYFSLKEISKKKEIQIQNSQWCRVVSNFIRLKKFRQIAWLIELWDTCMYIKISRNWRDNELKIKYSSTIQS